MHGAPKYAPDAPALDYVNPAAPKGGTLKQAVIGAFDTLNPHNIKGKPAAGLEYLYDRLAARVWDEPFTLYGLIAEKIIVPDDRSFITFVLNPAARFHDGAPITTADVAFSFETLKTHGKPNTRRVYALVDKVDIADDRTITFTLGEGRDRETVMILAMMPILPKHDWAPDGGPAKDFAATTLTPPVGSGPYRIASVEAGRRITYDRVPDYWARDLFVNRGQYNFDHLTYDYYRDKTVMIQAFQAGEFDLYREFDPASWINNFGQTSSTGPNPAAQTPAGQNYITAEIPHQRPESVRGIIFNTKRPLFQDRDIRRALALAFDFDWMNTTLFHGKARRIDSTFPNTDLAAPAQITAAEQALLAPYAANLPPQLWPLPAPESLRERLKLADKLLTDSGWVIKDGKRVNAQTGAPFAFTVTMTEPELEKIMLAYAGTLRKLGIDLTIRSIDSAQFVGILSAYDYDALAYRWVNTLSPGTEQQIYWGCAAAETEGSRNYARICTPAIDALAAAVATARTRDELTLYIHALDRAIMSESLFIPLYYIGVDYAAHSPRLKRPDTTPVYGMVVESWWDATAADAVPPAAQ